MWTSFAATGKPSTNKIEWKQLDSNEKPYKCLNISNELEMIDLPNTDYLAFWDSLYNY